MENSEIEKREGLSNFSKTSCIYYKLMKNANKADYIRELKTEDEEINLRLGSIIASLLTYNQKVCNISKEYNVNIHTLIQSLGYLDVNYDDICNLDISKEDETAMTSFIIGESNDIKKYVTIANIPLVIYLGNIDNASHVSNAIDIILSFNKINDNGKQFEKVEYIKEINNVRKLIDFESISSDIKKYI